MPKSEVHSSRRKAAVDEKGATTVQGADCVVGGESAAFDGLGSGTLAVSVTGSGVATVITVPYEL